MTSPNDRKLGIEAELLPLVRELSIARPRAESPLIASIEIPYVIWSARQALAVDGKFVEIGSHAGNLTRLIVSNVELKDREYWCVDAVRRPPTIDFAKEFGVTVRRTVGLSQAVETINLVAGGGKSIAWILIDGCHCTECVREDIDQWVPHVAPGGYVLVHDTMIESAYYKRTRCLRSGGAEKQQCSRMGIAEARAARSLREIATIEITAFPGLRVYKKDEM
jgi:hypothetical protein